MTVRGAKRGTTVLKSLTLRLRPLGPMVLPPNAKAYSARLPHKRPPPTNQRAPLPQEAATPQPQNPARTSQRAPRQARSQAPTAKGRPPTNQRTSLPQEAATPPPRNPGPTSRPQQPGGVSPPRSHDPHNRRYDPLNRLRGLGDQGRADVRDAHGDCCRSPSRWSSRGLSGWCST